MSKDKTQYSDTCGATNRNGEPCQLPAGWGTPGSQGGRCRFHGGCSTGPGDTTHLDGNDFAEDNPGGGPPKGNTNSRIHGGFGDWKKAYKRYGDNKKAHIHKLIDCMRERVEKQALDIDVQHRERLLWERATLSILSYETSADVLCDLDGSGPGRGLVLKESVENDGETVAKTKVNPAWRANTSLRARRREIAEKLRLYEGDW